MTRTITVTLTIEPRAIARALYDRPLGASWATFGTRLERLHRGALDALVTAHYTGASRAAQDRAAEAEALYLDALNAASLAPGARTWIADDLPDAIATDPETALAALVPGWLACGAHNPGDPVPCADCDLARWHYLDRVAAALTASHGAPWTAADVARLRL